MNSMLKTTDWSTMARRALSATEIVSGLAKLDGWQLRGEGPDVAIEKSYRFANYYETLAFVNAVAFASHRCDHHPELLVQYNRCVVRFNTHDVNGISATDLACAAACDALLQ